MAHSVSDGLLGNRLARWLCVLLALHAGSALAQSAAERKPKTASEIEKQISFVWTRDLAELDAVSPLKSRRLRSAALELIGSEREARIAWGEFLSPAGDYFLALHLETGACSGVAAGAAVTIAGLIHDENGEEVRSFEGRRPLEELNGRLFVEISLPGAPGRYVVFFGIADRDRFLCWSTADLDLRPRVYESFSTSRLILSGDVVVAGSPQPGTAPFSFGGIRVIPRADSVFRSGETIWFFFELTNPAVREDGRPGIRTSGVVRRAGEGSGRVRRIQALAEEIVPVAGSSRQWAIGLSLPAADLPPGDYEVELEAADPLSETKVHLSGAFRIEG